MFCPDDIKHSSITRSESRNLYSSLYYTRGSQTFLIDRFRNLTGFGGPLAAAFLPYSQNSLKNVKITFNDIDPRRVSSGHQELHLNHCTTPAESKNKKNSKWILMTEPSSVMKFMFSYISSLLSKTITLGTQNNEEFLWAKLPIDVTWLIL